MKIFLPILLSYLLTSPQKNLADIVITVTGLDEITGTIRIGLFNSEDTFLNHSFKRQNQSVTKLEFKGVLEDIPEGTYAISIYHDKNSNGELDSNFLRIPKEPYGFSNNPKTTFGPPDFQQASFNHMDKTTHIKIQLK